MRPASAPSLPVTPTTWLSSLHAGFGLCSALSAKPPGIIAVGATYLGQHFNAATLARESLPVYLHRPLDFVLSGVNYFSPSATTISPHARGVVQAAQIAARRRCG